MVVDAGYLSLTSYRPRNHSPSKFRPFIGAFAKFAKATALLFLSVPPSAHPHVTPLLPRDEFWCGLRFWLFVKNLSRKLYVWLKSDNNNRYFTWSPVYRGADKSLARPGKNRANVSIRMAWISFGVLPYITKKIVVSSRPWHASEVVSFLVGLRTYQHLWKHLA